MFEPAYHFPPAQRLSVSYERRQPGVAVADDVLALISFGSAARACSAEHTLNIALEPMLGADLVEVWHGRGSVRTGRLGQVRYREDGEHLFAIIEIDEREYADLGVAAEKAYAELMAFQAQSSKPHLLRIWNYFDAITAGSGDDERYQIFCAGRAAGLGEHPPETLPAATAIGRRDQSRILQVYWLAATQPGRPLENPRQISAYHYPRQYGPAPPRFARATLTASSELLISGTASVVGHATHHDGDVARQLEETLCNLDALIKLAQASDPRCTGSFGPGSLFKVYLRHRSHADHVTKVLRERLPANVLLLILEADVCRNDLLIEIDGLHR